LNAQEPGVGKAFIKFLTNTDAVMEIKSKNLEPERVRYDAAGFRRFGVCWSRNSCEAPNGKQS
jgi:hypothetical protein